MFRGLGSTDGKMALLPFEKAPFSAIFSRSIQMSSNQVNVAPETADGAIVAGPGPKSCLAKEIGNGTLRKSAKKRQKAPFCLSSLS